MADAVAATVTTAGRAVFFSGITVLLGLSGLVLFDFMVLRSVGVAGALVVGFAVAGAPTLLPAGLAVLGLAHRRLPHPAAAPARDAGRPDRRLVRRFRQPSDGLLGPPRRARDGPTGRRVRAHAAAARRVGLPFIHVRFNAPDAFILPAYVPPRQAYDTPAGDFGEATSRRPARRAQRRLGHGPGERRGSSTTTRARSLRTRA
ncbi:MAG: MMPL family transporter [Chloroflexota bacterium]